MKPSTRQRFVALRFDYPSAQVEQQILVKEGGIDEHTAFKLVELATALRRLEQSDLEEVVSTRLLIYAGRMMKKGISALQVCRCCLAEPLSDDPQTVKSLMDVASIYFDS
jgi:nitric oxide reductase NorQ protein